METLIQERKKIVKIQFIVITDIDKWKWRKNTVYIGEMSETDVENRKCKKEMR